MSTNRPAIYLVHENDEWLVPLREALTARGAHFTEWNLGHDLLLPATPPEGVFYARVSASSHTRDHRSAPEYGAALLEWLAAAGRRVFNGARAVDLEISKARQYVELRRHAIAVPDYELAMSGAGVLAAARRLGFPLIVKPNRGGKGAGVQRFDSAPALETAIARGALEPGPDQLHIVQKFIDTHDGTIVRCEFVGGALLYAVEVNAGGSFELCPAEACAVGDTPTAPGIQFSIRPDLVPPDLDRYREFLAANAIEIAGLEFMTDREGKAWTYDVNTNTNYNPAAEAQAGLAGTERAGMGAVARLLHSELHRGYPELASAA